MTTSSNQQFKLDQYENLNGNMLLQPSHQEQDSFNQLKDEVRQKKDLLQKLKGGQRNVSLFEQDLINRHEILSQQQIGSQVNSQQYSNNSNVPSFQNRIQSKAFSLPGSNQYRKNSNQIQPYEKQYSVQVARGGTQGDGAESGQFGGAQEQQVNENPMLRFAESGGARFLQNSGSLPSLGSNDTGKYQNLLNQRVFSQNQINIQQNGENSQGQLLAFDNGQNQLKTLQNDKSKNSKLIDDIYSRNARRQIVNTEQEDRIQDRNTARGAGFRVGSRSRDNSRQSNYIQMSPPRQYELPLPKDYNESNHNSRKGSKDAYCDREKSLDNQVRQASISIPNSRGLSGNSRGLSGSPSQMSPMLSEQRKAGGGSNGGGGTGGASYADNRPSNAASRNSKASHTTSKYQPDGQISEPERVHQNKAPATNGGSSRSLNPFQIQQSNRGPQSAAPEAITEQDTTQEISSIINPHPKTPTQNQQFYVVTGQDDSQYIFTSVNNSQSPTHAKGNAEKEAEKKFVFNSRGLQSNDKNDEEDQVLYEQNTGQKNDDNNQAVLSEPQIQSQTKLRKEQYKASKDNSNYRQEICILTRNHDKQNVRGSGGNHHTGGSFGNLVNYGVDLNQDMQQVDQCPSQPTNILIQHREPHQQQVQNNNSSTFIIASRMLEGQSRKVNEEPTSPSNYISNDPNLHIQQTYQQEDNEPNGYQIVRNESKERCDKNQKVRIVIQQSSGDHRRQQNNTADNNLDSSFDFKDRKYNIIRPSSEAQRNDSRKIGRINERSTERMKEGGHRRSRSRGIKMRNHKNFSSSRSNERGSSKRQEDSSYRLLSRKRKVCKTTRLSTESASDSPRSGGGADKSQESLRNRSKGSYGRYFVKSRQRMAREPLRAKRQRSKKSQGRSKDKSRTSKSKSFSRSRERKLNKTGSISNKSRSSRKKADRKGSKVKHSRSKSVKRDQYELTCNNQNQYGIKKQKRAHSTIESNQNAAYGKRHGETARTSKNKKAANNSLERATFGQQMRLMPQNCKQQNKRPPKQQINIRTPSATMPKQYPNMNTIQYQACPVDYYNAGSNKRSNSRNMRTIQHQSTISRNKKANTSKQRPNNEELDVDDNGGSLAQKLLVDLAKKYKNMDQLSKSPNHHCHGLGSGVAAQKAQMSQMVHEIQSLAVALINAEKKVQRIKQEKSYSSKKYKQIISDQEECINLMQEKIHRIENKHDKLQRKEERVHHEKEKGEQKFDYEINAIESQLRSTEKKLIENRNKYEKEKKDIIIGMEKELQSQAMKLNKKHEIKLKSIQSINDQLNVKLQEFDLISTNLEKYQNEYNNSLQIINEYQEQIAILNDQNEQLNDRNKDVQLQLDHAAVKSQNKISDLKKRLEEQQTKYESQLSQMKKDHQYETQKQKMAQGQVEDSQKYQYEEQISNLEMKLKAKEEKIGEQSQIIEDVKEQMELQRELNTQNNEELLKQYQESEQQREIVERKQHENEIKIQQLERIILQKENSIEKISQDNNILMGQNQELTERSENEKDSIIKALHSQLDNNKYAITELQDKLDRELNEKEAIIVDNHQALQQMQNQIELQKQEIHILAQGFQAQQAKINMYASNQPPRMTTESTGTGKFAGLQGYLSNNDQQRGATGPALRSTREMTKGTTSLALDPKEASSAEQDNYLLNHQNMNIQSSYDLAANESQESHSPTNESQEMEQDLSKSVSERQLYNLQELQQRNGQLIIEASNARNSQLTQENYIKTTENTQSLLSTDQLSNMSPLQTSKRDPRFNIQNKNATRGGGHTFGGKNPHIVVEESYQQTSVDQSPIESKMDPDSQRMATKLDQKNEEIQILWNVIQQMNQNKSAKQSDPNENIMIHQSFGRERQSIDLNEYEQMKESMKQSKKVHSFGGTATNEHLNHLGSNIYSGGNQSSIMGINPATYQYLSHGTNGDQTLANSGNSASSSQRRGNNNATNSSQRRINVTQGSFSSKDQIHVKENGFATSEMGRQPHEKIAEDLLRSQTSQLSQGSANRQELIDVKKRIERLMGGKLGGGGQPSIDGGAQQKNLSNSETYEDNLTQQNSNRKIGAGLVGNSQTHSKASKFHSYGEQSVGIEQFNHERALNL